MASTNAERQRRHRAHKAGDHSLCDPGRRCDVTSAVTAVTSPAAASTAFGPGGELLWKELDGDKTDGGRRVLIVEACRITDRLDKLDRLLAGRAADWVDLVEQRGHEDVVEVVIDKPLAEARQQATALKQIVAELRQAAGGEPKPKEQEGDFRDELAARRKARLADAAGR